MAHRGVKDAHIDRKMSTGEGGYHGHMTRHGSIGGGAVLGARPGRHGRLASTSRHNTGYLDPLVCLLCKPPTERKRKDIERLRGKIRKLSPLMGKMDNDMLDYTLKHVQLELYKRDEIIVKEGDIGSKFYVILSGAASVFTGQHAHRRVVEKDGARECSEYTSVEELTREQVEAILTKSKSRNVLGKYYSTLGQGYHFGELALLSQDGMRNASVVSDGDCSILCFDKDLYDHTIKLQQTIEFERKHQFISSHPFFCHLSEKCRNQLQVLMEHQTFGLGEDIITQTSPADLIIFLTSGEARITTEPTRHKKQLCSEVVYTHRNAAKGDNDEEEVEEDKPKIVERRPILSAHSSRGKNQDCIPLPHISDAVAIRRIDGYVAAERKSFDRVVDLCFVRCGEVFGDIEFLTGLSTYLFTVKCTSECEVYFVPIRAFERQIIRKSLHTLDLIRSAVEVKLKGRMSSEQGKKVSVLPKLLTRLQSNKVQPGKIGGKSGDAPRTGNELAQPLDRSKCLGIRLPSQRVQVRQITKLFMQNKVPLLVPYTNGAVYYRELSRKRARLRAEQREFLRKELHAADFPSVQRQLSDAKLESHKETILYDKKRQRLMSKGNIEQIDINRWK